MKGIASTIASGTFLRTITLPNKLTLNMLEAKVTLLPKIIIRKKIRKPRFTPKTDCA
jgi:hypothetical protein